MRNWPEEHMFVTGQKSIWWWLRKFGEIWFFDFRIGESKNQGSGASETYENPSKTNVKIKTIWITLWICHKFPLESHLGPNFPNLSPTVRILAPSWLNSAPVGPFMAPTWLHLGRPRSQISDAHCAATVREHLSRNPDWKCQFKAQGAKPHVADARCQTQEGSNLLHSWQPYSPTLNANIIKYPSCLYWPIFKLCRPIWVLY